jgi:hypothetical protein
MAVLLLNLPILLYLTPCFNAGDTVDVPLTLTVISEPKIDMYYLTDISSSMKDDLESVKNLADTLGEKIKEHTRE